MAITLYHNPRCRKSREALHLLQEARQEVEIREYLKEPPTVKELTGVIKMLDIHPLQLIRKQEKVFKEQFKGQEHSEAEWIKIMVANPILIERPIAIKDGQAVVGRPPENISNLLG